MRVYTKACHIEKAPVGKTDVITTVLVWTVVLDITDVLLCKYYPKYC